MKRQWCQSPFSCENVVLSIDAISMENLSYWTHFPITPGFCSKVVTYSGGFQRSLYYRQVQIYVTTKKSGKSLSTHLSIYLSTYLSIYPSTSARQISVSKEQKIRYNVCNFNLNGWFSLFFHLVFFKLNSWSFK